MTLIGPSCELRVAGLSCQQRRAMGLQRQGLGPQTGRASQAFLAAAEEALRRADGDIQRRIYLSTEDQGAVEFFDGLTEWEVGRSIPPFITETSQDTGGPMRHSLQDSWSLFGSHA
jgi:hypothetical protein